MPAITAIETYYAGCLFRSRLEARWAVFFDHLGIEWQYECEGYQAKPYGDTGRTYRYLPDFYLPATQTWVEAKGTDDHADWELLAEMIDWGSPMPGVDESYGTTRGVLLLGPIPYVESQAIPYWTILQHHKGIGRFHAYFDDNGLSVTRTPSGECSAPDVPKGTSFVPEWVPRFPDEATDRATAAYIAGRSARFEHGEKGATWR